MLKLSGKIALVTGAASGIGRASAILFAREGARVVLVDRDDEGLRQTLQQIKGGRGEAISFTADVGSPGAADAVISEVERIWEPLQVLMTAAGYSCGGTVETTSVGDWNTVFQTNVGGTWLWAKAAIPGMRSIGGGSIITVASQLALAGGRASSAYIAAKGAVLSLTRTMALDFASDSIRVNAVVPGAVETPMLTRSFARHPEPGAAKERVRSRHPLGRFGRPEEIAKGALYLASDESSFVTGTMLVMDGGWLAA